MRVYLLFLILFTLAEILFTLIYFLLTGKVDEVVIGGLVIYAAGMITSAIAYNIARYRRRKKEMIDNFQS